MATVGVEITAASGSVSDLSASEVWLLADALTFVVDRIETGDREAINRVPVEAGQLDWLGRMARALHEQGHRLSAGVTATGVDYEAPKRVARSLAYFPPRKEEEEPDPAQRYLVTVRLTSITWDTNVINSFPRDALPATYGKMNVISRPGKGLSDSIKEQLQREWGWHVKHVQYTIIGSTREK